MKPEASQTTPIKVTGHLEEFRGIYQMVLSWKDSAKRRRQSISTGLAVRGNKRKAEDMLLIARREKEEELANKPVGSSELLFADFMEQWLEVIRKEVRPTTFGTYQMNVQKTISPYFRERAILLVDLTADDINEFYEEQLGRVKAMTVTKYHAHMSKALKYAVEKNLIPHSVMDNKVKRPKPDRFVGKFLRQNEVIKLFEAVKDHKLELGVILGAFYGLRRAEVLGIRWESIDFDANTITIEHTVIETSIDGKKVIIADDTTKSKSSFRTLPLVPAFRAKLLAVRNEQERNQKLCGRSYNKKDIEYIYTDLLGNRIKPNYLTCAFPEFLEKNGFKRMRFHDLRHSCASLLLANGVPLKQIQEWLGHSDFAITANTYAHLDYTSKMASAKAMSWIDQTSLAQTQENREVEKPATTGKNKDLSRHLSRHEQKAVKTAK